MAPPKARQRAARNVLFCGRRLRIERLEERRLLATDALDANEFVQVIATSPALDQGAVEAISSLDVTFSTAIDPDSFDTTDVGLVDVSDLQVAALSVDAFDGTFYDCAVEGTLVYAATGEGLLILDVSDPSTPALVSQYATAATAQEVVVADGVAYLAEGSVGLELVDVTDSSAPVSLGTYDTPGEALGMTVIRNRAYVADVAAGLEILNISDPAHVTLWGQYDTPGSARRVQMVGRTAYVADSDGGLQILNVTLPGRITLLGEHTEPGHSVYGLDIVDDVAYTVGTCTDTGAELQILDIANPASIAVLGTYTENLGDATYDVDVVGDNAFLADDNAWIILDVSDPANVAWTACYWPSYTSFYDLEIVDDVVYAATDGGGLQIFQTSAHDDSGHDYPSLGEYVLENRRPCMT